VAQQAGVPRAIPLCSTSSTTTKLNLVARHHRQNGFPRQAGAYAKPIEAHPAGAARTFHYSLVLHPPKAEAISLRHVGS